MTHFHVTYKMSSKEARDGYYNAVKERGIIDKSRAEDGCIRYDFFFPADSDTTLFLWEQWESRDHQMAHCQTAHFAEMGPLKDEFGVTTDIDIVDA